MRRSLSLFAVVAVAGALLPGAAAAADPITEVAYLLKADLTAVDTAHPVVKITGKLLVAGTATPVVGKKPAFLAKGDPRAKFSDAKTGDDGEFTVTYTASGSAADKVSISGATPSDLPGVIAGTDADQIVEVKVTTVPTKLTVAADKLAIDPGEPLKLSGRLTAGDEPVGGAQVKLTGHGVGDCTIGAVTADTGADGGFAATVRPECWIDRFTASAVPDGLLRPSSAETGTIFVRGRSAISLESRIDAHGRVSLGGVLNPATAGASVPIEFSANGRTGWKRIKTLTSAADGSFRASFTYKHAGHWRARRFGTAQAAPATSPVVKAWRKPVRVTKQKLSPGKIRYRKKATLSGVLQQSTAPGRWKPFAKRTLKVWFTCDAKKAKGYRFSAGTVKTDARGRFTKKVTARCTGAFYVEYPGASGYFALTSKRAKLKVSGAPPIVIDTRRTRP
ncbi:hypothetical protein GCM10027589_35990 [Actinocorallia lasiicapitis]